MLYNRKFDRLLLLLIPAALIVYASTRPHFRLKAEMPPEFVDLPPKASREHKAAEERLAREYWQVVQMSVQWKYTYGSSLPESPPAEFRITGRSEDGAGTARSSRLRYWRQLRKIWVLRTSWVRSQEWTTHWLTDPIIKAASWIQNYVRDLFERA